jgi:ATP-dependent Clp protease ATP-binding subunit ClpA
VDARHAVFIMTSNVGTKESSKALGFGSTDDDAQPDFTPYLKQFFRIEFLNRVDEVVTFRPLDREILSEILDLRLKEIHVRLREQRLVLELRDDARQVLLDAGFDPVNGARPLQRAIERLMMRPLSSKIVEEAFQPGATVVALAADDGKSLDFKLKAEVEN